MLCLNGLNVLELWWLLSLLMTGLVTLLTCTFLWPSSRCSKPWVCLEKLHMLLLLSHSLTLLNGCLYVNLDVSVPVATFIMAVMCGTDKPRCDVFLNMLLVSVGVVISSYGEIHFNVVGTVYQVTGIFAEALRLVLTQVLLQKKGLTLNPVTSLYYIAPCRYFVLKFLVFLFK